MNRKCWSCLGIVLVLLAGYAVSYIVGVHAGRREADGRFGLYLQMLGMVHEQSFKALADIDDARDIQARVRVFQKAVKPMNPDIRLIVFGFEHAVDTNFSEENFDQVLRETRVDISPQLHLPAH